MKTLLFLSGLIFNLLLCLAPLKESAADEDVEAETRTTNGGAQLMPARDGISYSDFLKNKAVILPGD